MAQADEILHEIRCGRRTFDEFGHPGGQAALQTREGDSIRGARAFFAELTALVVTDSGARIPGCASATPVFTTCCKPRLVHISDPSPPRNTKLRNAARAYQAAFDELAYLTQNSRLRRLILSSPWAVGWELVTSSRITHRPRAPCPCTGPYSYLTHTSVTKRLGAHACRAAVVDAVQTRRAGDGNRKRTRRSIGHMTLRPRRGLRHEP